MIGLDTQYDLESLVWSVDEEIEADFHFFREFLAASPGLALDMGCGTGRLLLEYLRLGFQVEGCDICPTMLELCGRKAAAAGVQPVLHHLALQDLSFAGRYNAIYLACATFMCITEDSEVDSCLRRLHTSLAPGGRLALHVMVPKYLHLANGPFPTAWEDYFKTCLPDNLGEIVVDWRAHAIDSQNQLIEEENRYRLIRNGSVIREEFSPARHRWYQPEQLIERLQRTGFKNITPFWDYSTTPGTADTASMAFIATRG